MNVSAKALSVLPSPAMIVDLAVVDSNIRQARRLLAGSNVKLRPHFKAHKCTTLIRRQISDAECAGVTCQTSWESLILAQAGFADILVTNQIVDRSALEQLAAAARLARITVAADSFDHVRMYEQTAQAAGVRLEVLVEIDVGMGRCGLEPGDADVIGLARALTISESLSFAGLQAYEGHAVLERDRATRAARTHDAAVLARNERARLEAAGIACGVVSGGGTGTLDMAVGFGVLDEVQAGSYVLYDSSYSELDLGFSPAVFCLATVISSRDESTAVINAGFKQLSTDSGYPAPVDSRLSVVGMSDEHTRLRVATGALAIGDRILLVPSHLDPTMNLHESLFACAQDDVSEWPIDGRMSHPGRRASQ